MTITNHMTYIHATYRAASLLNKLSFSLTHTQTSLYNQGKLFFKIFKYTEVAGCMYSCERLDRLFNNSQSVRQWQVLGYFDFV